MTTWNSNLVAVNAPGKYGVYPQSCFGTVAIPDSTTLATNDVIPLCNIAPNAILEDFIIALPDLESASTALILNLQDTQDTPVVYVNGSTKGQGGGVLSMANDYYVAGAGLGTVYTASYVLQLVATTGGSSALSGPITIRFRITWAPS